MSCGPRHATTDVNRSSLPQDEHGRTYLEDGLSDALLVLRALRDPLAHLLVQHDERERQLAAVLVWGIHDAHVRNLGVVEQVALQLRWGDLEPAYLN